MERAARIELASSVWKAAALPLSYSRLADGAGVEPARPDRSRRISIALPYRSANHDERGHIAAAGKLGGIVIEDAKTHQSWRLTNRETRQFVRLMLVSVESLSISQNAANAGIPIQNPDG
jgi:hypothetical protein